MKAKKSKAGTSLVLRVCGADMSSSRGFVWPGVGEIATAPDWNATPECGHGLHGWLHGQGDQSVATIKDDSKWLAVEVETNSIIQLGGKVKFPSGLVMFAGDRKSATDFLLENDPLARSVAVIGAQLQVGDKEAVTVGALGTATAGDGGTATAGYGGTATAGYGGTATAGDGGTATAGYGGTATAGDGGILQIKWYDGARYRIVTGYVGEDKISADTPYQLDSKHKLIKAAKTTP